MLRGLKCHFFVHGRNLEVDAGASGAFGGDGAFADRAMTDHLVGEEDYVRKAHSADCYPIVSCVVNTEIKNFLGYLKIDGVLVLTGGPVSGVMLWKNRG